jgi:glutamate/tyrosine decarboxylase-like PLP-dependent enzyme
MFGFSPGASGLLVSGGSMANLVGLAVARNTYAGFDLRGQGLRAGERQMVLYGSQEMHSSLQKSVELLGLGSQALRKIPVNAAFQIDLSALQAAIAADRQAGFQPFCIIANAGTVNTGAIDPLDELADICRREDLWLHVDGAFGAFAALSPELRPLVKGLERADSLGFDLHKWMYVPFEAGCALVRQEDAHWRTFSLTPEYLEHAERGAAAGEIWYSDYGLQLTRGFRALKVWFTMQEQGLNKLGRMVRQNVEQARYLQALVSATPELELLAPVPLNIVCFRFRAGHLDEADLNGFNQELLVRLHESGVALPSYTTLNGAYALRACITNHRSRREDFEILAREVVRLGKELVESSPYA